MYSIGGTTEGQYTGPAAQVPSVPLRREVLALTLNEIQQLTRLQNQRFLFLAQRQGSRRATIPR